MAQKFLVKLPEFVYKIGACLKETIVIAFDPIQSENNRESI
jgi:hypothetical protein